MLAMKRGKTVAYADVRGAAYGGGLLALRTACQTHRNTPALEGPRATGLSLAPLIRCLMQSGGAGLAGNAR